MSSTRLYPHLDVSILNSRYAQYKSKATRQNSLPIDKESLNNALFDDEEYDELLEEELTQSSSGSLRKETLFEEDYDELLDGDYDDEEEEEEEEVEARAEEELQEEIDDDERREAHYTTLEKVLRQLFRLLYRMKQNWKTISAVAAAIVLVCILVPTLLKFDNTSSSQIIPNVKSFDDISKSIQRLQWQIDDSNTKQKHKFQDMRNYLDLKMDEISGKFTQIDSQLEALQREHQQMIERLENLRLDGVDIVNSEKIPVVIDGHNNVQLLPEFKEYLHQYIRSILTQKDVQGQFQLNYEKFVQDYIDEIVSEKIGFMKKEEILSLVTMQFQENKRKLIQEIKQLTQSRQQAPDIDNTIPQRLIPKRDYEKKAKLNYAQVSNGARLINYLSSPTFCTRKKNGLLSWLMPSPVLPSTYQDSPLTDEEQRAAESPLIVLTNHDGFWKSSSLNASLGIMLLDPIYINEFQYTHKRVFNSALLTSCPKAYEVFVQPTRKSAKLLSQESTVPQWEVKGETTLQGGRYTKVMECVYDVNGDETQSCEVPDWLKPVLVRSLVIRVRGNYGNELFTSLYKFKVHGLTPLDLASVERLLGNEDIGEGTKRGFRVPVVRSFGEDVVV